MPRKDVVKVRPTSDAEVARSPVTCGNAGVYMSVANGGTALCKASVNTKEVDTAAPAAPGRPTEVTASSFRIAMTWSGIRALRAGAWSENHDLPGGGAAFHLGMGLPDLIQLIDAMDGDHRLPVSD